MSILIPSTKNWRTGTPTLTDFGGVLTPPLGGPAQKLNRMGNRYSLDIEPPTVATEPDGRIYAGLLSMALTQGGLFAFPQPGLAIGNPGAPVVNGGGQLGSTLALRGFTPGYVIRFNQFFSIILNGRRYLYASGADIAADGAGNVSLPLALMLRRAPADGATCEFAQPYIEGWLKGQVVSWKLRLEPYTDLPTFTIAEAE
ncbi:hypothetical protein [Sphingomonas nostoxanthinifaciens]|uniref:hypothetical protein n=1 Tax=Sphingomonas nostoxanthinifaciens TaxID=2872652 RepID=UPI001CC20DF3|nr:hypothetical protein [Sphingomonas nostoxanthinifaciens]UAK23676.1 hypothetical protein K8P63_14990 [Sphingomonas nostoxanthinifaciens]